MDLQKLYTLEKPEFYDDQANSLNPLRRWFHRTRHKTVFKLVNKYLDGTWVADIGCGNVVWNFDNYFDHIIGVDINNDALKYNLEQGRIAVGVHSRVDDIKMYSNEIDLAVCSEVIEHIPSFWKVMEEAYRILKPGGYFITSVPYDTAMSLWRPLFKVQCFHQGKIKGDEYYKQECGHVNYFSPRTIRMYLEQVGFEFVEQFDMKRFTIFTVVRKPSE